MKFVLIHYLLPDYVCARSRNSLRLGFQIREFILFFSYFSSKTYVVGSQKNGLNERVLLSTQTHV